MTITINNAMIVVCIFYFFLSAFLSYLFRQSNIFLKLVVFFFIIGLFVGIESVNRLEVTIASVLGFLFIYTDTALDFLFGVKSGIETVLFGFFGMIRQVLRFILLPIANCFTWFYNLLSRFFGWNLKFHRLGEHRPKDHASRSHRSERRPRRYWRHKGESPRREDSKREQSRDSHRDRDQDGDRKSGHSSTHRHSSRPSGTYKPRSNENKTDKTDTPRGSRADKPQTTRPKYTSSADQQKQDSINRAKEEVRQAREQSKRKEEQRQGNTSNSSGNNANTNSNTSADKRSHQQVLGLSDNYTVAELTKAYKMGTSRYHPDKYAHMSLDFQKEAQNEFIKIKKAYDFLLLNG
jgi:type III secretory pathway component EscR